MNTVELKEEVTHLRKVHVAVSSFLKLHIQVVLEKQKK